MKKKYSNFWLAFVNLKAKDGLVFSDLIDFDGLPDNIDYNGAWANIIVKANNINDALEIISLGLSELEFDVVFIDKIENIGSLIEYKEVTDDVKAEVDWLLESDFVFKISDKIFPYYIE
ncbi:hypothetical protein [Dysgonomonas massiliensis]|uniref:hypothetical protein n=1 Tax=Dysgonomonas massiliensis TaxID=2040292 RepID=UPI000C75DD2C|nr:hypothetical protein [Dysgonomonas massiliensis]